MMSFVAPNNTLQGAVALITGARGAIGHATCSNLFAAGARVIGTDLGAAPEGIKMDAWLRHDVTSEADWNDVISRIQREFGRLDCLVNCAGICPIERILNTSRELWRKISAVNFESILLGMQAALPLLQESGKDRIGGASIVNVASVAGLRGSAFAAAYCASKGAVTLFTKAAAKEFAALKYPIRVNSVHPSAVDGPMMDSAFARFVELGAFPSVEVARAKNYERNPMGRMARAEEVASGISFLCSPASSFMNGAELVVDGGFCA